MIKRKMLVRTWRKVRMRWHSRDQETRQMNNAVIGDRLANNPSDE
jgi:hypothetical protein